VSIATKIIQSCYTAILLQLKQLYPSKALVIFIDSGQNIQAYIHLSENELISVAKKTSVRNTCTLYTYNFVYLQLYILTTLYTYMYNSNKT